MVREQFRKRRYVLAGILTLMVFLLGLMLGLVIEGKRLQYYQNINQEQRLDYASLQLQYEYINQLKEEKNCPALLKAYDESVKSLEGLRSRLEMYSRQTTINKNEFEMLRREYMLEQVRYFLFAKQAKELCNQDAVTILYFYSSDAICTDCGKQEFILTYLKKKFGDRLLNFAFDERQDDPMIKMLKQSYDLKTYPSLIISGDKYEGFMSAEDLLGVICGRYVQPPDECKGEAVLESEQLT